MPTTTRTEEPAGQTTLAAPVVSGNTVRLTVEAPYATRFTFLHQAPGSAVFLVVVTESPEASLALSNLAAGLHRFKAVGSNSRGDGPESAVVEATLALANAA